MTGIHQWGAAEGGSTVIQAGRDVNLGGPADPDPEVAAVAAATEALWYEAESTWDLSPDAPVRIAWGQQAPQLLSADVVTRLYDEVYDRAAAGVAVVMGAPGIGKSSVMHLLLREALRRRRKRSLDERGDPLPVPVWLTLGDWDPVKETLADYAARVVGAMLRPRWHRISAPGGRLVHRRRVALFLDGLDEMPEGRRGHAVEQITKLGRTLRVVVTTRPRKRAPRDAERFANAELIRLHPVDVRAAADFLVRDGGTTSPRLRDLAEHVRADPHGVLAKTLTTPLTIGLARDAFGGTGTDRVGLAELTAAGTQSRVVSLLAGLFLDRAYSTDGRPGRLRRKRQERRNARERAFAAWIARSMNASHDLTWWRIPTWIPLDALRVRCAFAITAAVGLMMAVGAPLADVPAPWSIHLWPVGLTALYADWQVKRAAGRPPARLVLPRPSARAFRQMLVGSLIAGAAGGFLLSFGFGVRLGAASGATIAVLGLLGSGLYRGAPGGLLRSATSPLAHSSTLNPVDACRADRRRTATTAIGGTILGGVAFGLLGTSADLAGGCALWGAGIGFAIGCVGGLGPGALLPFARPDLPGFRRSTAPLPTLKKAVARKVLRQAGVLYQFRHAAIQEHLCSWTPEE